MWGICSEALRSVGSPLHCYKPIPISQKQNEEALHWWFVSRPVCTSQPLSTLSYSLIFRTFLSQPVSEKGNFEYQPVKLRFWIYFKIRKKQFPLIIANVFMTPPHRARSYSSSYFYQSEYRLNSKFSFS